MGCLALRPPKVDCWITLALALVFFLSSDVIELAISCCERSLSEGSVNITRTKAQLPRTIVVTLSRSGISSSTSFAISSTYAKLYSYVAPSGEVTFILNCDRSSKGAISAGMVFHRKKMSKKDKPRIIGDIKRRFRYLSREFL